MSDAADAVQDVPGDPATARPVHGLAWVTQADVDAAGLGGKTTESLHSTAGSEWQDLSEKAYGADVAPKVYAEMQSAGRVQPALEAASLPLGVVGAVCQHSCRFK